MEPMGIRLRLIPKRKKRAPFVHITIFYEDDSSELIATPVTHEVTALTFNDWEGGFALSFGRLCVVEEGKRCQRLSFFVIYPDGSQEGYRLVMSRPSLLIGFTYRGLDLRFE